MSKKQLTKQQQNRLRKLGTGVRLEVENMKKEGALNDQVRIDSLLFYLEFCAADIFKNRGI